MATALLLVLLLEGPKAKPRVPPRRQPHYWKDAQGQVHMTDTPPPAGAEVLASPPPSALQPEAAKAPPVDPLAQLPPELRARWEAIRTRALSARAQKDRAAMAALVHEVTQEARWGDGRRAALLLPIVGFAFLALIGWWLALGLHGPWRPVALGLALLAALAVADVLVVELVNRPQVPRLREDLKLLVQVAGPADSQSKLDPPLADLDAACSFGAAPWSFRAAVAVLELHATALLAGE